VSAPAGPSREYLVFDGAQRLSLRLVGAPGPLISMSAPPPQPGSAPAWHPFVTATFLRADNEGDLGELLRRSASLEEYLAALAAAGFVIREPGAAAAFGSFQPVQAIGEDTIARFAGQVPAAVVDLWRSQGAGFVGEHGFFRFVDPARAALMLEGVLGLPDGATVLFATALGDLVIHVNGLYLVIKSRWGAIDLIQDTSVAQLIDAVEDAALLESVWEWQPYPEAAERDGVPGFEQCFGFVPLLALGGRATAENLRLSGLYEHLEVIAQMAGQPQVRRVLELGPVSA